MMFLIPWKEKRINDRMKTFEACLVAALEHRRADRDLIREAITHLADTTLSASKRDECMAWLASNQIR